MVERVVLVWYYVEMANTNEYMRSYMENRRRDRKAALTWLLGGSCQRCSCVDGLEFDHVNPTRKSFEVSGRAMDKAWETLVKEAMKCQLLCHPCHVLKTSKEWKSGVHVPHNKVADPGHGSGQLYAKPYRCRCEECCSWKRRYRDGEVTFSGDIILL
jgi:hypothetical protein